MASVWYLVVAGGGGVGKVQGTSVGGGGGGAGGFRTNGAYDHVVTVQAYVITVGAGGIGATTTNVNGGNGQDSVFDTITSIGGGGGSVFNVTVPAIGKGSDGGSGGGGARANGPANGGAGTAGQGNNGGASRDDYAGGGGGAGAVGGQGTASTGPAGSGGAGTASTITGASVTYAGGGGGGGRSAGTGGGGGSGGGGAGGADTGSGTAGTANTGGGAGGMGGNNSNNGVNGGSGIVIIRYHTADLTATGGTITTDGPDTIHTFTSSGTFEVTNIPVAPVADFSGTPTSGASPLSVTFTDLSTNTPTSWAWTFGDGDTSTSQNPTHVYQNAGSYTVTLTASNSAGSDLKTRPNYITVTSNVDKHDGGRKKPWRQRIYYAEDEVAERAKEYRIQRERLRSDLIFAMDGQIEGEVLDIIREHVDPVDIEKFGVPDYEPELKGLLSQTDALRQLAALVLAEHKRLEDEDEEDVAVLLLH